jgi:hypothetical protein
LKPPACAPAPRERGILFSKPMVAALLAGTKTQTRRALPAPPDQGGPGFAAWHAEQQAALRRRYGAPGERLWVRERFVAFGRWQLRFNPRKQREESFFTDLTRATGQCWRYEGADPGAGRDPQAAPVWHPRPALFMPRAASRILLEITDVRIERLQAIGAADALAEGILRVGGAFELPGAGTTTDPVLAYRGVWERINGAGSWEADPWVAVVGFRLLERPR